MHPKIKDRKKEWNPAPSTKHYLAQNINCVDSENPLSIANGMAEDKVVLKVSTGLKCQIWFR